MMRLLMTACLCLYTASAAWAMTPTHTPSTVSTEDQIREYQVQRCNEHDGTIPEDTCAKILAAAAAKKADTGAK